MKNINELKTEREKLKKGSAALGGLLIVMVAVCIYGTVQNGIDFMTFLPVFFMPMLVVNYFKIQKLSKEIIARDRQQLQQLINLSDEKRLSTLANTIS